MGIIWRTELAIDTLFLEKLVYFDIKIPRAQ